ncbi:hypothetical protein C8J57DRAFT_1139157 [Mycena rebaudengoi]|nr:hypothetical protein C8J57DRAFT_1139157 [Mycena rebaudengoi]
MSAFPAFNFHTTAEDAATALASNIKGKNVLITGTSLNGIGFEAARVIVKYANLVIITGYNDERLKLSEDALKIETPSANIRRLILDLSSFADIRRAAAEVNAYPEPIHVLVHNAAAAIASFKLTVDKLENQIQTDHFGPFLFTKLLVPKVLAAKTADYTPRVVFVASDAHALWGNGVDLEYFEKPEPTKYDNMGVYVQAKSANILTALELSKRAKGALNAYSLHPGLIMTNLNLKDEASASLQSFGVIDENGTASNEKIQWKTIPEGAATTVVAAFDPKLNDKPGSFIQDGVDASASVAPHSSDPVVAEKLWILSEKIIGEKFEL